MAHVARCSKGCNRAATLLVPGQRTYSANNLVYSPALENQEKPFFYVGGPLIFIGEPPTTFWQKDDHLTKFRTLLPKRRKTNIIRGDKLKSKQASALV